jgi:glycosyltransferase involved in cell wall biosynthesis
VGGTEQAVALIDEGLVRRGHRSIVIAAEGSKVAGELVKTPAVDCSAPLDQATWDWAYGIHRETLRRVLEDNAVDVIHLHGVDFQTYLTGTTTAVLATLHLPRFNYPADIARPARPLTFLNCVSRSSRSYYEADAYLPIIPYGIALDRFRPGATREDYVLTLGRIVPEKGFHQALDAARLARLPLLLAGSVPPFPEARRYFEDEIKPRLDAERRFIGPVPLAQRVQLMAGARCVVIPSLVEETGPLVAMESQACGTPVVANRIGALPENVLDRRTGFIVDDVHAMAQAFHEVGRLIDPEECRRVACQRFDSRRMADDYILLYEMIAGLTVLDGSWSSTVRGAAERPMQQA